MSEHADDTTMPAAATVNSSEPDWVLQALIRLANNAGIEFGITLHLSGMVVAGTVVSGKAFFESIRDDIPQSDAAAVAFATAFDDWSGMYPTSNDAADPVYIHLRDARVWSPAGEAQLPGTYWRGRVSEISGWTYGALISSTND